jgi:hypothetical protein
VEVALRYSRTIDSVDVDVDVDVVVDVDPVSCVGTL